jgi:hypothetical protein
MRVSTGLAAVAAIALVGCGKSGNQAAGNAAAPGASESAGTASGSAAAGGNIHLNPGEWETTADVTIGGLGNLPPQAAQAMKGLTHKVVAHHCLTPEKAAHPSGELFGKDLPEGCAKHAITMSAGAMSGTMTCKDPRTGGTSTTTIDGHFTGDTFDMNMKMAASHGGQNMTMTSHTVGRRIGACPAGGDKED